MQSASSTESTFRQSEKKLYSGSPFPGFRAAAAFWTCSGVTFLTSLRASAVFLFNFVLDFTYFITIVNTIIEITIDTFEMARDILTDTVHGVGAGLFGLSHLLDLLEDVTVTVQAGV